MGKIMYQASSVHRDRPLHLTVNHQCTENTSLLEQETAIFPYVTIKKKLWTIFRKKTENIELPSFDTLNIFIVKSYLTSFAWTTDLNFNVFCAETEPEAPCRFWNHRSESYRTFKHEKKIELNSIWGGGKHFSVAFWKKRMTGRIKPNMYQIWMWHCISDRG